ncbi:hypothetical protein BJY16_009267 [Actinoplanes octamycinicus]|uniref:Uncharacterized protein n=1 Tax=Actinoplanes octamycinicus TaxID=135948 RepID=A0A7W7H8G9_9ACTN|nr:hypothetical protein [Actinoplanes octamycinicus]MBB4745808.1 hypothetical protein [Actinoplanes octamycinicus]GIE63610.1 hypothetical protein Aoc01nite_90120 [Actinoplanes octamycinicus]
MSIAIPASLVQNGTGIPDVCSRHGEAASLRKPVKFWSKPPAWSYLLIFFGALPFLIVTLVLRKEVQAQAWPFCEQCVKLHKTRLAIGIPLIALLPIGFGLAGSAGDAGALLFLLCLVLSIVGFVLLSRGTYRVLPWGFASRDGSAVDFPKAHPTFVAAAQAAYAQAAQQYAAWQASQQAGYGQPAPYGQQAPYGQPPAGYGSPQA